MLLPQELRAFTLRQGVEHDLRIAKVVFLDRLRAHGSRCGRMPPIVNPHAPRTRAPIVRHSTFAVAVGRDMLSGGVPVDLARRRDPAHVM